MKREKTNGTESVIVIVWTFDMWPLNKSKKEMSLGLKKNETFHDKLMRAHKLQKKIKIKIKRYKLHGKEKN